MNDIINDIKVIIKDMDDVHINLLCKKAIVQIRMYLNKDFTDDEIIEKFKYAIEQIAIDTYLFQKSEQFKTNISRISQGSRNIEFNTQSVVTGRIVFSSEVKSMLPKPFVKML